MDPNKENVSYSYGKTHELKTWPSFFNAIINEMKTFEVRQADRHFAVGDNLLLREWSPITNGYTGACCTRKITYILPGGDFGVEPGYCVLGLKKW